MQQLTPSTQPAMRRARVDRAWLAYQLLDEFLAQRRQIPPTAAPLMYLDELPPSLAQAATNAAREGLVWRAWTDRGRVTLIAAELFPTIADRARTWSLRVTQHEPDGTPVTHGMWRRTGAARWLLAFL